MLAKAGLADTYPTPGRFTVKLKAVQEFVAKDNERHFA
jgi:hypothetical protein